MKVRGGYGELCSGVGGVVDAWDGAGAVCHVVGTMGAVGVVKAGERCAQWWFQEPKVWSS